MLVGFGRGWEVAMPGLALGPLEGRIEPDLHNLVVQAEHPLAHADHPWVAHEVDESADGPRMDLNVPPARAAADRPAGPLDSVPESGHHVLAHHLGPVARKSRG